MQQLESEVKKAVNSAYCRSQQRPSAVNQPRCWKLRTTLKREKECRDPWQTELAASFVDDIASLPSEKRSKVFKMLSRIISGKSREWNIDGLQARTKKCLWERCLETTHVGNDACIAWWVELNHHSGQQYLVIYRLVKSSEIEQACKHAARFLRTFSDAYLKAAMVRCTRHGRIVPHVEDMVFPIKRKDTYNREVLEDIDQESESRPVSLEKRYRMNERYLQIMCEQNLQQIRLPNVLDEDEQQALEKVLHQPLFLLGRSGSGKTTLQVHALYYLFLADSQFRDEEIPGPVLLVTRSKVLAASIRRLFKQMLRGLSEVSAEPSQPSREAGDDDHDGSKPDMDVELGVVGDEITGDVEEAVPRSFRKEDVNEGFSPIISSWSSFIAAADASLPGVPFFRRGHRDETEVQRALRRQRQENRGNGDEGTETLEQDGSFDLTNELTLEILVSQFRTKLQGPGRPLQKEDSLFVLYKEILTIISGSIHALRSRDGCLSRGEYVTGRTLCGRSLPEMKDSANLDEQARQRFYDAFEIYVKLKIQSGRYDRVDPIRHITKRAQCFNMSSRNRAFRMLSAVFIDEVQDLLPCEILLLRLFCRHNNSWIFAGDTAQTISNGVEFRFESIRRLYFEEFLTGKDWTQEALLSLSKKCSECGQEISKSGGTALECSSGHSEHHVYLCDSTCYRHFELLCERALKAAGVSVRRKHEWAKARGKLNCPKPGCALYMKESPLKVNAEQKEEADEDQENDEISSVIVQPRSVGEVPPIHYLTHNHRSSRGILDLANSIIDVLVHLFPDKIDKLAREVSTVDVHIPPVFITKVRVEEALDIILGVSANPPGQQQAPLLEFGAKQAVLVWSDSMRARIKQRFPLSIVMTIHDSKGLEFQDVLIMNPFSDMANSGALEDRCAGMWKFVHHYMIENNMQVSESDAKRVSSFDPAVHGLLNAWLKALYVSITRARQRVWIFEEGDEGKPILDLWTSMKIVHPIYSSSEAANVPDIARGFAEISSAEDFAQQGRDMLLHRKYEEAVMCFTRAERLGRTTDGYGHWKQFALLLGLKHDASLALNATRQNIQAGDGFMQLAQDVTVSAGLGPAVIPPRKLNLLAAECYLKGDDLHKAGSLYIMLGDSKNAKQCWEGALQACVTNKNWTSFLELVKKWQMNSLGHITFPQLEKDICHASRKLDKAFTREAHTRSRQSQEYQVLKQSYVLLSGRAQDMFLEGVQSSGFNIEVMENARRFGDCVVLYLERRDWRRAQELHGRYQQPDLSLQPALSEKLHLLGLMPSHSRIQRIQTDLFHQMEMHELESCIYQGLEHLHSWTRLQTEHQKVAHMDKLWKDWVDKQRSNPGHSLRFLLISFVLCCHGLVSERRPLDSHKVFVQEMLGKFKLLISRLDCIFKSLHSSMCTAATLPNDVHQTLKELLLLEQPLCISPDCLVLADVQPERKKPKLSFLEVLHMGQACTILIQLRLHGELLNMCHHYIQRSTPCWSCAAHPSCLCQEEKPSAQEVEHMLDFMHRSLDDTQQLLNRKALSEAKKYLGDASWNLVCTQRIDQLIEKCQAQMLQAYLPHCFVIAPLPKGTGMPERFKRFLCNLIDLNVQKLRAKTSPIQLADLLAPPAAILFTPVVDYHGLSDFRRTVQGSWKTQKEAKWLIETYEIASAASPVGRDESVPAPKYWNLVECVKRTYLIAKHTCDRLTSLFGNGSCDESGRFHTAFSIHPHTLCHLLEQVVVWSNVILTRFTNTTLPQSYVHIHLACHSKLATLAAENPPSKHDRRHVIEQLGTVPKLVADILKHQTHFRRWLKEHSCGHAETLLRFITAMLACGSINWLKHIRHDKIRLGITELDQLQGFLKLMNDGGRFGHASLPKELQWLMLLLPRDKRVDTVHGERGFDQMSPWLHSILADLRNPYVILHRSDTQDAPPGWTSGRHGLRFQMGDFLPLDKSGSFKRVREEVLGADADIWPQNWVNVKIPAVPMFVVYKPGTDKPGCCFESFTADTTESPITDPLISDSIFELDKSGAHGPVEEVTLDDKAAVEFLVVGRLLRPRFVTMIKKILRRVRRRLSAQLDPKQVFHHSVDLWLRSSNATVEQRQGYHKHVVPVLHFIGGENAHMYSNLRSMLSSPPQNLARKEKTCADAVDWLIELDLVAREYRQKHDRQLVERAEMKKGSEDFWIAWRALWEDGLLPKCRNLGIEHLLIPEKWRRKATSWAISARHKA